MCKEQCNLWPPLPKNRFLKISHSILQKTSKQLYLPPLNKGQGISWCVLVILPSYYMNHARKHHNYHGGLFFIVTMEYIVIIFSCLVVVTIIFTGSGFEKAVGKIPPQDQIGLSILLLSFLLTISGLPHHGGFGFSTIARCAHLYNATQ